ncbi:hypothetical protein ACFVZW_37030 [Streptomyces sp. NPDC059567]|uniref:hypothetical protein n=1 Tax=Streptomyces sp. NPDC059567 TaxID=3346867 RepID=UPI0036AAAA68
MLALVSGVGPAHGSEIMTLYAAVPLVLIASLVAASGVAAVTRGWVLPMNRRYVRAPRLYGWGQLVMAFAMCWQVVFGLVISDSATRQWGTLTGGAILLVGLFLMAAAQRTRRREHR